MKITKSKISAGSSIQFVPLKTPDLISLIFNEALQAEISIIGLKNVPLQSKAAKVHLVRISPNGLTFHSELLFPINPDLLLNFRISIVDEKVDLKGTIKWSQSQSDNNLSLYEVTLLKDEDMKLVSFLNNITRHYLPVHLRTEYYEKYFLESTHNFNSNLIDILM
jgi:hypothetical protein